jgi:hypothetical protein
MGTLYENEGDADRENLVLEIREENEKNQRVEQSTKSRSNINGKRKSE